jgi:hypothetical protein
MTKTVPPLDVLETQIVDALAELRGARLDRDHSPNADTERTVEYAEYRLDLLFERRAKAGA